MQINEFSVDERYSVLLGRQPIIDRAGALVAYELLFRGDISNAAVVLDDRQATEQVIVNAIAQFGITATLGTRRGFVNIGRSSLDSDIFTLIEPNRFTLEILENVVIDTEVEARCRMLRQRGFQIALDDVTSMGQIPNRVLALLDIVKIDVLATPAEELPRMIHAAHSAGRLVLVEKVETLEDHRRTRLLGADLFQGYFFARPEVLSQAKASASQAALLRLNMILAGDPCLSDLQSEVKCNPLLLGQLMKFSKSAFAAGRSELTVGEAIARVGTRTLARLAQLLLFAAGNLNALQDNPLLQMVNTRARFMELMALEMSPDDDDLADAAFQTGIFSLLHVVTSQSSEQLLAQVALAPRIQDAILGFNGPLGKLLLVSRFMEGFEPQKSIEAMLDCGLGESCLNRLFAEATSETLSN